ncbi:MAG: cupin domain-containing protein [Parvularculaceae bacterium]
MKNAKKAGAIVISAAALALVGIASAAPAYARQCPADQSGMDVRTTGATEPVGVSDDELSSIDLQKEIEGVEDRRLRFRKLEVQPNGVVPWHDHTDRPALIYTAKGEITEYRSDCKVGVTHKAGDISTETAGLKHWWKNEGKETAILYAADVKHDQ